MINQSDVRSRLKVLLGSMPPPITPHVTTDSVQHEEGYTVERFHFDNGADVGSTVPGVLLIPDGLTAPAPAALICHAHGRKYMFGADRMLHPHFINGYADGIELVKRGFVVMGIDAYAFGDRQYAGPAGLSESGGETELSLFKHFLWQGSTLWGMMIRDDLLAVDYLVSRPEVDAARLGVTGMSMGGSRATWIAALDDRVAAVVPVGQMTHYRTFASGGNYALHSIYYYVPRMLASGLDMEYLVALAAPRSQTILIGDSDPLSPIKGVREIEAFARQVYAEHNAADRLTVTIYPGVAHAYTPDMARAMVTAFETELSPPGG